MTVLATHNEAKDRSSSLRTPSGGALEGKQQRDVNMNTNELEGGIAAQYKIGMRRLASGVSLITTGRGDMRGGLIATAVNSVSADPPTLLICVNQSASAHDLIVKSGTFCVNFLPAHCAEIAGQFSSSARKAERFVSGDWTEMASGSPALGSALAAFDCEVVQTVSYHSHTIFIGLIREVRLGEGEDLPLIYLDRNFHCGASSKISFPA